MPGSSSALARFLLPLRALAPVTEADVEALAPPPPAPGTITSSPEVSALLPAHRAESVLAESVRRLTRVFAEMGATAEILIVPNGEPPDSPTELEARRLEAGATTAAVRVRAVPRPRAGGKGSAVRQGLLASRGNLVLLADADLPFGESFIRRGLEALRAGECDAVTANRRLPDSEFDLSVDLLPVAVRRHRLGLAFNLMTRLLIPAIRTRDTQAGMKWFRGDDARRWARRLRCPGFFYDLELWIHASREHRRVRELPVTLRLESELSTVRVVREGIYALGWLARIAATRHRERRLPSPLPLLRGTGAGLAERGFLALRWSLTPFAQILSEIRPGARVLELGCGHGLAGLSLLLRDARLRYVGLDVDGQRLSRARAAGARLATLRAGTTAPHFHEGSLARARELVVREGRFDAVLVIDVLHYLDADTQARWLREIREHLLVPEGVLLARDVDPRPTLTSRFNRAYERAMTASGLTRSSQASDRLHFRRPPEWERALAEAGFGSVRSRPCSHWLFADVLYTARPERAR